MSEVSAHAIHFHQLIASWNILSVTNMADMLARAVILISPSGAGTPLALLYYMGACFCWPMCPHVGLAPAFVGGPASGRCTQSMLVLASLSMLLDKLQPRVMGRAVRF